MPDSPLFETDEDGRLPPGVPPSRRARRSERGEAVGASRPADAYPEVGAIEYQGNEADDWVWDDGRYVRVTRPAGGIRKFFSTTLAIVVLIGLLVFASVTWVRRQMDPPGPPGESVAVQIPSGATTDSIASLLAEEGIVENPTVFRYYLRWQGVGDFQAGAYTLAQNMSFGEAIEVLRDGPAPVQYERFTVPEGLTLDEIAATLSDEIEGFDAADMPSALVRLESPWRPPSIEGIEGWEGLLFPDTYEYELGDEPAEILRRMSEQFDTVAREVGLNPLMNLDPATANGLPAYEYIIIASMIQAESRVPEEYGMVSRVIHNRLYLGMPLGIDATVLYARSQEAPEREGGLTDEDLAIDSPYNTRLHPGLPPTPIAAPGQAALDAALNPEEGPWLYYVLASEDGRHFFTDDYDEFIRQRDESRAQGLF